MRGYRSGAMEKNAVRALRRPRLSMWVDVHETVAMMPTAVPVLSVINTTGSVGAAVNMHIGIRIKVLRVARALLTATALRTRSAPIRIISTIRTTIISVMVTVPLATIASTTTHTMATRARRAAPS